jgi:hypothetical protein
MSETNKGMIGEIGENFVVTEDHLDGFSLDEETIEQYMEDDFTMEFNLYDDDDILYYTGLILDDAYDDDPFEPLDYFMYDSGCTRIDYRKAGTDDEFETL